MKVKKKSTLYTTIQLMGVLQTSSTQELITLRQMLDSELFDRKFDLKELEINRKDKFVSFIHWLKYGTTK